MRLIIFLIMMLPMMNTSAQSLYLFIGTYTKSGSKGIYVYRFNNKTGKAELVSNTEGVSNPSYLAIARGGKNLYAVNENDEGTVSAFSFDSASGKLTFLNSTQTGGAHPCYITVDKSNKWVIAGNYSGGNLACFPVNPDGSIESYSQLIQHTGTSINKERQEKAHVHCTVFSPDEDFLFTPDLGMDKVMIYAFQPEKDKPLSVANPAFAASEPGSGPRHLTFHPNEKFAYLIEEISGTVVAYSYSKGSLTFLQRIATHPVDYKGKPGSADIHVSPDGKYLYASNRGEENNIAIFSIDNKGKLVTVGYQTTGGKTPRNFIIDPTGKYLLVANQDSNNVVIFTRDIKTGLLQKTGEEIKVPSPVCIKMLNE